jgi:nickel-type superoxide dismutase maturation protease
MRPALEPGDRLLVDTRVLRARLPRIGEIVVLRDPIAPTRWLIKRVGAVDAARATVEVRGDAADRARDSRQFGPVPFAAIVGVAYRRYAPSTRRAEL